VSYSTNIQITEIYPRPSNADNQDEFVELFNFGDSTENLDGWKLEDRAGKICDLSGDEIEAKSFLVITENSSDQCNLALNNTQGETLNLFNPQDSDPVFSVSYTDSAKKGLSYSLDGSSWRWSKFLTPGAENIFNNLPTAKTDVPEKVYRNTFADFSAKGSDKDKDELKYTWDFGDGHKSYKQITRHKYEKTGKYSVTLKISDGSEDKIKTFKLEVENFPKLDVNIIELSPNPAGVDTDVEYILLKNASKKKINLKGWSIATGEKKKMINHPITLDLILKPKKEFKLTHLYSKFSLNNTSARIELRYPNGKVASHVTYKSPKKSLPEDSLYEKIKGGWAWKFPAIKPKDSPIVATTEASMIAAITQPPEKTTQQLQQEMETQNNLGNFSPDPTHETKKQEKFSLLNFGLHIQTASAFSDETLQPQKDFFATPQTPTHKHWATQLRDDLFFKINSWLNGVL